MTHHTTRFRRDPLAEIAVAVLVAGIIAGFLGGLAAAPVLYGWAQAANIVERAG